MIEICSRPFLDNDEQTSVLTCNWNAVVGKDDEVWVIGDFCMNNPNRYLKRLNGVIRLIRGNHDRTVDAAKAQFDSVHDVRMIRINGQNIWLSHYAHRVWPKMHYGSWHLFGHSHGGLRDLKNFSLDVGVDARRQHFTDQDPKRLYAPWTFEEVKLVFATHTQRVVDRGVKVEEAEEEPDVA